MQRLAWMACLTALAAAPPKSVHPTVEKVVAEVDPARIAATMKKLEGFGSRESNGLVEGPGKGVVAARQWILDEMKSYSPRLQVRFDSYPAKKGGRIVRDTEIVNVVAVLPGRDEPAVSVLVGAHYDSMHMKMRQGATTSAGMDSEATAREPNAPGVSDNASGVACVMELARVMSRYEFSKTVVFIAFAGEEQGLLGAKGYADRAAAAKDKVEALLNVDTIGNDVGGSGLQAGQRVNVYSGDPADSGSRALARYIRETSERYLPGLAINAVFRPDRFGRGGDHTPFHEDGFAAVRFTTPTEQLENQHNEKDNFERVSVPYTTLVTRGVGASLASLALAPKPPLLGTLGRGAGRYDAALRWKSDNPEKDLAGYAVVLRSTTAPFWEREIWVGKVTDFTLKDVPIDEVVLGVKAVNADGLESLVRAWTLPERRSTPAAPSPAR